MVRLKGMKRFETIEHTADIGIRAFAADERSLFENASAGMFSLITDLEMVDPAESFPVAVEGDGFEEILVAWLNELLYVFESNGVLLCRFEIDELDRYHAAGQAMGEPIDPGRHRLECDIKAVTYHMLRVEHLDDAWVAEVIFDV